MEFAMYNISCKSTMFMKYAIVNISILILTIFLFDIKRLQLHGNMHI